MPAKVKAEGGAPPAENGNELDELKRRLRALESQIRKRG